MSDRESVVEGMNIGGPGYGKVTIRVKKHPDGSAEIIQWFGNGSCRAVTLHASQVAFVLNELDPSPGSRPVRPHGEGGRA